MSRACVITQHKIKPMDKILISIDEPNFNKKLNSIKSLSIELNKLLESFLKLSVVAEKGIDLESLLYDETYINKLLSERKDISKIGFKNHNELHKFFLDQNDYNSFNSERIRVSEIFKKLHIPLNYYRAENGFIDIEADEIENLKEGFRQYATTPAEINAYNELTKVCKAINNFNNSLNIHSSGKLVTPRGINIRFARFDNEQLSPTLQGVQLVSQCVTLNNDNRVKI